VMATSILAAIMLGFIVAGIAWGVCFVVGK
jgi:hypothetical protein